MMISTPMEEFLNSAEQQLSGLFSCAKNAHEFQANCEKLEQFIANSHDVLHAPNPLPFQEISRFKSLLRKLTTVERVAKNNAALIGDMPDYVDQSLSGLR